MTGLTRVTLAALVMLGTHTSAAEDPVSRIYLDQLDLVEHEVMALVETMPADAYGFAPMDGAFVGVRTFGEQVAHVATMIFMTAARVLEEPSPSGPGRHNNGPEHLQSKAELVAYLRESLAYARRALESLTVENHLEPVASVFGEMPRAAVAAGIAYHSFNHYGQMVVYARMNGVVPPASVPTGDERRR